MEKNSQTNLGIKALLTFSVITALNLIFQVFMLRTLGSNAILLLVALDILFVVIVANYAIKNIFLLLLIVNLIPLVYFNNVFHYTLLWVLIQDLPLFLLLIIGLFKAIRERELSVIRFTYLNKMLYLFGFYFLFLAILGFFKQRNSTQIINELYHALYYVFAIVLAYQLKKRSDFRKIFILIIAIGFVVGIENIYMNLFSGAKRFVTFQTDILCLPIGLLFSYLLFYKKKFTYYSALFALLVIITGVAVTLTRSLWISVVVTLVSILLLYLKQYKKVSVKKMMVYSVLLIIPVLIFSSDAGQSNSKQGVNSISYRTQSIANPSSDLSFLMRVEIGYYVLKEFLKEPVFGSGLGASVQYKLLAQAGLEVFYPDNSLLYFLWKGGIIGFIILIWLYIRLFRQTLWLFKNNTSIESKILVLGVWGGIWGLWFAGLFAASLIKYKFDIIIALVFAYIEFEKQNK
jgi:O-antigen ligase